MSSRNHAAPEKISRVKSISAKIMLLVFACVVITVAVIAIIVTQKVKSAFKEQVDGSLLFTVESEQKFADSTIGNLVTPVTRYELMLSGVQVSVFESSYCFVVNPDNKIFYHPVEGMRDTIVDVPFIYDAVKAAVANEEEAEGVGSYTYNGTEKLAAYAETLNGMVIFACVDKDEAFDAMNGVVHVCMLVGIIMVVISLICAYFMTGLIKRPIRILTEIISDTADFNFSHNPESPKIMKRGDETGAMARAIAKMRKNLRAMIADIENSSDKITENVTKLQEVTQNVNIMCSDNSATSQQIAAGMEETSATTEDIYSNVGLMVDGAKGISGLSEAGDAMSLEVMQRASALKDKTIEASRKTEDTYVEVKTRSEAAIEKSKAVDKINELTGAIMAISSQTSLLALNASIEAARAGEAGRGFAVVATEISNLAAQTSQTVTNINAIVEEVNDAVGNMAGCLEETGVFLENTVLTEFKEFTDVSEQYNSDAVKFKDSMNAINDSITELLDSIDKISDSISGINTTISESSIGVSDIAGKTADMATSTGESTVLVKESLSCIEQLREIVASFTLE